MMEAVGREGYIKAIYTGVIWHIRVLSDEGKRSGDGSCVMLSDGGEKWRWR